MPMIWFLVAMLLVVAIIHFADVDAKVKRVASFIVLGLTLLIVVVSFFPPTSGWPVVTWR